jgi:tetratricopeptide (TPR) repeat protein
MKEKKLSEAMKRRSEGEYKASNDLLAELVKLYPEDPTINYQCAWSFDALGKETAAVPFYEKAISSGLSNSELEGAYLGLGSTYRTIGEYIKSAEVLKKGIELFPDNRAFKVFYSMTLYNLDSHSDAMGMLLNILSETTNDQNIIQYKKAIEFYSDKLDHTWE